ncbi:hypothetical protein JW721_05635 [Candidatus Micrarchaeota archaeon]|nr:hypothetical protein [Candidatus Micrarchaeota archaeon]
MDKGLIVKILVVFLAGLFLLEPFAMTMSNWMGNSGGEAGEYYSGAANVNVTIYGYGAFLYVQGPTQLQLTQIENNAEVLSLEDVGDSVYRITLRDSAKTREVYLGFEEMGISTLAIAQIGLPEEYDLVLSDGSTINISGGYEQLAMAPAIEAGNKVSYILEIVSDGKGTLGITNAQSYTYEVGLEIPGAISDSAASKYVFSVPWEERNLELAELESEYGEGNVAYSRADYIIFEPELGMEETLMLKRDYMTYISSSSATVAANFTDTSLVEGDFAERAVFPNSSLIITSPEVPELGYDYVSIRNYEVSIPNSASGYSIGISLLNLTSAEEFSEGDSVVLKATATVTGDMVILIREISMEAAQAAPETS